MKLQYIIVLVLAGLAYGLIEPGRLTYAFGHATLYMLLPPLLFEAAWNLQYRAMVRQWRAILTLAIAGVALTAVVVAGALSVVHAPFGVALLAGAILSATDPITVVGVFRRLKVPQTLRVIVECEALFNDAVAVVLYRAVLLYLLAGAGGGYIVRIALESVAGSFGGIGIGVVVAFAVARILRKQMPYEAQIVATVLCAYGTYFGAEALSCSGIFAVISCGIALRYFERRWISLQVAEDVNRFWDLAALAANAMVFFLVGAALHISILTYAPAFVIAALIGVAVSRAAVSGLLLPARFPREWLELLQVAGMRGALSLALAVALPQAVPYRDAIIAATFAVALGTIVASGLTLQPVVERVARARR